MKNGGRTSRQRKPCEKVSEAWPCSIWSGIRPGAWEAWARGPEPHLFCHPCLVSAETWPSRFVAAVPLTCSTPGPVTGLSNVTTSAGPLSPGPGPGAGWNPQPQGPQHLQLLGKVREGPCCALRAASPQLPILPTGAPLSSSLPCLLPFLQPSPPSYFCFYSLCSPRWDASDSIPILILSQSPSQL